MAPVRSCRIKCCGSQPVRAVAEPDVALFSTDELRIIEEAIQFCCTMSATEVSAWSHSTPAWDLWRRNEVIPYYAALIPEQPLGLSEADQVWAAGVRERINA